MAILKNPQQDGAKGHVGEVIYFSRFGAQLTRRFPKQYHDKNSLSQQNQRYAVFKPLLEFTRRMKGSAKSLYQTQPRGKSAFAFLMHQLRPAFGGSRVTPTVDLTMATIGNGDLMPTSLLTAIKATSSSLTVTWDPTLNFPNEHDDDSVYVMLSLPSGLSGVKYLKIADRAAGTGTITVPTSWEGLEVNVSSPQFKSVDNKHISPFQAADPLSPVNLA